MKLASKHPITEYSIQDIVGLNDDGIVELVLAGKVREGWSLSVWEYSGSDIKQVFLNGWGH